MPASGGSGGSAKGGASGNGGATGGSGGATGGSGGATGGSGGTPAGNCTDQIQNNGETGVDCGGPCPKKCIGGPCATGSDCTTNFCADGVCCDGACDKPCVACTAAKKGDGSLDGTCGPVKAGTNPDHDCDSTASDVCNGNASAPACQCHDAVQDGDETGVDCGGVCPTCGGTCSDQVLNNQETDTDCGGPICGSTCAVGHNCASTGDCQSGLDCYQSACCQPDPPSTTCSGFNCGNVTNNCGISVPCGTCAASQVCVANKCLNCSPGSTQKCLCTGTMTCDGNGNWGACVGGTDINTDTNNCGACGICCPSSCAPPGGRYVCQCGKCYDRNNCSVACTKNDACFKDVCGC